MTVTPVGTEFQVNTFTTGTQSGPAVAVKTDGDGDFIITWESDGQDGDDFGVFAQRYNADGTPEGNEFQVNTYTTNSQGFPSVAADGDGDFIITWSSDGQDGDDRGVFAQRYNADGTPNGSEFQVNTNAGNATTSSPFSSAVAVDDDGNFAIVWSTSRPQAGGGSGVFARRYNADGTPNGSQFQVNTFSPGVVVDGNGDLIITAPSAAQDGDGNFISTWSRAAGQDPGDIDIFAQRYSVEGVTGLNLEGGNGKDTLTGEAGDDTISGGNGKDELFGLAGDDIINGDNGPDLLDGGLGNDILTGGNGPDLFVLAAGEGTDMITDFSNPDSIGLSVGIGFSDLSFSGEDIILTSSSEVLATLTGVDTTTLNSYEFTTV
ncbi:MAG: hypothetical protein WBM86_28425 [Waterburya sp.]